MKKRSRTLDRHCVEILIAAALTAVFFALGFFLRSIKADRELSFWKSMTFTPEPERCALCGNGERKRYHAPCIVKLATGEIGELRVYDPHPDLPGELAPVQQTGTFSFLPCADVIGWRDTSKHVSHVTLPEEAEPIDPARFCRDCRALLADTAVEGYVLLDLYDPDRITPFPIADGARSIIRDYTVSISGRKGSDSLDIYVTGNLRVRERP